MIITGLKGKIISELSEKLESGNVYRVEVSDPDRTLDANAYYWALLRQYAAYEGHSDAYMHNELLARFGKDFTINGQILYVTIPDTDEWMENPKVHLRPTSDVREGRDGKLWRTFIMRAGSHTYSKKEFSRLIDGLIEDIKASEAPIETLTRYELEKLKGYKA